MIDITTFPSSDEDIYAAENAYAAMESALNQQINEMESSHVLVFNRNGEISCYYLDEAYPRYLAGFIRLNTSGALVLQRSNQINTRRT